MNDSQFPKTWRDADESFLKNCAAQMLRKRLKSVRRAVRIGTRIGIRETHRLRVEIRQATIALVLFAPVLDEKRTKRLRKNLRNLRNGFGPLRETDVFLQRCFRWSGILSTEQHAALAMQIARTRFRTEQKILKRLSSDKQKRSGKQIGDWRKLMLKGNALPALNGQEWIRELLAAKVAGLQAVAEGGLPDIESIHQFRIRCRLLRYALETLEECIPSGLADLILDFRKAHSELGSIHDAKEIVEVFAGSRPKPFGLSSRSMQAIIEMEQNFSKEKMESFLTWWHLEKPDVRLVEWLDA